VGAKHDCHGKSEAQSEQRSKDSCRFPPESYDQEQAKDELCDGHSPSQGKMRFARHTTRIAVVRGVRCFALTSANHGY
jgi:hypothetical protein